MLKTSWYGFLALCLPVSAAFAQNVATGTLVGTVTDNTGGVVAKAVVVVTNTQTQVVSRSMTNADGAYYVPFLGIGTYQLTVESPGFKKYEQSGIVMNAGETPRIDVRLEVGAVTDSVRGDG